MKTTAVQWSLRREWPATGYHAPSAVHLAEGEYTGSDIRVGSFPLLCGRWAPDGLDAMVERGYGSRTCKRCRKAAEGPNR